MKVIWCFIAILIFSNTVFAGNENGNGGDVVYCTSSLESAELLDFYEARVMRGMTIDLGMPMLSVEEKIQLALRRLSSKDPFHYLYWQEQVRFFWENVKFIKDVELVDIPDSSHIALPSQNCRIRQVAVQNSPIFPEDRHFIVSQNLWDIMDNDSKAGLVLHEVIYKEALNINHRNSIRSRYINSLLASPSLEKMTTHQYWSLISSAQFPRLVLAPLNAADIVYMSYQDAIPCLRGGRQLSKFEATNAYPLLGSLLEAFEIFSLENGFSMQVNSNPNSSSRYTITPHKVEPMAAGSSSRDPNLCVSKRIFDLSEFLTRGFPGLAAINP